jgi:hypothetical protein
VVFDRRQISAESATCAVDEDRCARVTISALRTTGGGTEAVRENIDLFLGHDLVSRLRGFIPDEVGDAMGEPEQLAAAFIAQQRAFVDEFPDTPARWFIEIETTALHTTSSVTTLEISETAYTGGAHPNTRRRVVSFDVASGQLLGPEDLVSDIAALTTIVERQLRSDVEIGPDGDLEDAGFWLPEDGLRLPDNIGVVADGLLFHWDPYEIAPYSMGAIDVTVRAAELAPIVTRTYWN